MWKNHNLTPIRKWGANWVHKSLTSSGVGLIIKKSHIWAISMWCVWKNATFQKSCNAYVTLCIILWHTQSQLGYTLQNRGMFGSCMYGHWGKKSKLNRIVLSIFRFFSIMTPWKCCIFSYAIDDILRHFEGRGGSRVFPSSPRAKQRWVLMNEETN